MDDCCDLGPLKNDWRTVYRTDNFFVIPSIGPLQPGHLLVQPKDHVLGYGQLDPALDKELSHVIDTTKRVLAEVYGKEVFTFEHGPRVCHDTQEIRGGGCMDHAHLHLVPLGKHDDAVLDAIAVDMVRRLQTYDHFRADRTEGLDIMREIVIEGKTSYMLTETSNGARVVFRVSRPVPSQYIRRQIGEALSFAPGEYDWAAVPREDIVEQTIELLLGKF
ncbi:MAG TPA: HIT domain-containing protein [Candidatus Nanoarchaeia archaeon]|nr:HIT domain-containing protein [Candidatus Nanoarchaeia archaeon]